MRSAPITAVVALAIPFALLAPRPAVAAGSDTPSGSCNVASSGIGSGGNTVTCNFGMPPEQLKAAIEAAVNGQLIDRVVQISKTLGVTEDAAKTLLKIVGDDSNIPDDKLADALTKVASDYKKLETQVAALNPDNPTAKALVEQAKPEIEAGHFQRAHEFLHRAIQVQIAAAQQAYQIQEQARAAGDAQMLGAASSTAAEGDVALTERRYTVAAELFGQAAGYVPNGHKSEHGAYLIRQEYALYRQGDEFGDNAALGSAIEVCKRALVDYPRSQVPLEWANTQNDLGNALSGLGWREVGTEKLVQAVEAYRAAIEERSRERVPLQWATTQSNLGVALVALGERVGGTTRLEEVVAAHSEALKEFTRERAPFDWAWTQVNLGDALRALGERESGTARLEEAVAAHSEALKEFTRERFPLDWARTQNNLGFALWRLGERESGTARLEQAVAAFRGALEELTHERVPLDVEWWATVQNNLGSALSKLGERESGTARLEDAVAAYRAALQNRTRERVPLQWAKSFGGQGVAKMLIADRTNDAAMAEAAVTQIETAYTTLRDGGHPVWAAEFEAQVPKAKAIRDRLKSK